jgi:ATP-dependent exoDNAse (exonuclease V) beta subunit
MIGGSYADQALQYSSARDREAPRQPKKGDPDCAGRGGDPVEIHLIEKPSAESRESADHALELEARLVARRIQALMQEGFEVYERDAGWRPLGHEDIAIILRSPGPTGAQFAHVLRQEGIGVDFGGQDFFERQEVRDFLNLLQVLDNAHDERLQ